MARRHFLITYDVSNDKRRTRLFQTLQAQGDHAQYSVFFCDLTPSELASLRTQISDIIHTREDQVLLLNLGSADRPLGHDLEVLGSAYEPLVRTLVV